MKLKTVLYGSIIFVLAIVGLIYAQLNQAQKTVPKVKLSYFDSMDEFALALRNRLEQETLNEKSFWFGIEPEKENHLQLAIALKKKIELTNGNFDFIFLDQELHLKPNEISDLVGTVNYEEILVRDDWSKLSDKIALLQNKKYFLITAAIYSTSFLKDNPVHKIKNKLQTHIMTFSSGYFSSDINDEPNGIFRCSTEDKEGVSGWGCALVNKSRSVRKKLNINKKSIAGLMDLSGEKDYMILLR